MGVVHIKNRVTRSQEDFQESRLSDRSLLYIDRPDNAEPFSLELNVGTRWSEKYGTNDNTMFQLEAEGIDLPGRGSMVVEVADEITVPHNMYGIIVPTGSLFLDKGVIIAAAKVEPSFHGKLKLRLVNTLTRKVRLAPGDKVASAIFFGTETTEFQTTVTKGAALVRKESPRLQQLGRWISSNRIQVISWIIQMVSGAVFALILMQIFFRNDVERPAPAGEKLQTEVSAGDVNSTAGVSPALSNNGNGQGSRFEREAAPGSPNGPDSAQAVNRN